MRKGTTGRTKDRQVADAREVFLSSPRRAGDIVRGLVRDPILSSWQRSHQQHVDATHIDLPHQEPDLAAPLVRAAEPVLADLKETLHQDAAGVILTDADGLVLLRLCSDRDLARHLDQVQLATGYSYSEQFVGTNGIGTALESLAPTLVYGHEHYVEHLERLACGGVPVRHPVKGTVLGLLDITTWANVPSSLLLSLARSTAQRIERNLLQHSNTREQALLAEYLKTCQHTGGAVFAIGPEIMMMNDRARQSLDPDDQTALVSRARDALESAGPVTLIAELPSGTSARLHYRPAFSDTVLAGGVVHVRTSPTPQPTQSRPTSRSHRHLPGLMGSSSIWQRCCQQVESRYLRNESIVLRGEDGVGKTALLRAVHHAHDAGGHLAVLQACGSEDLDSWLDTVRAELEGGEGTLVISHMERIHPDAVDALGDLLQEHSEGLGSASRPWVAATMSPDEHSTEIDAVLLPHFMHTIEVPALRHHIEDLHELVPRLLSTLGSQNRLTLSSSAMRQLMRAPWPGNVTQLRRVLLRLLHHHRTGTVTVDDLPPECRSMTRRQLSQIESLERDAIVDSLVANGGDKDQACRELGMSRATIYRRIRRYGITV
jgi:sigma-54 dependent transcriptional regulator, acetoin dehydrogenase operon transcriptional activator AcoR